MDMFFYHRMLWRLVKHVPSSMAGGAGYTNRLRAGAGGPTPPQRLATASLVATDAAAGGFTRRLPGTFRSPDPGAAAMARPTAATYFLTHCPAGAAGVATVHGAAGRAAARAGTQRLYRWPRREAVPTRRPDAGARLSRCAGGGGGAAVDRRAAAGAAAVAALSAPGGPASASGRYYALRAADDGDGGGRAAHRGADASSRARMAVGGAGRRRVRVRADAGRR